MRCESGVASRESAAGGVRAGVVGLLLALGLFGCGERVELGPIVTLAESGASNPTVAVGPDGAAYVAWVAESNVWLARSSGSEWSAPVRVNDIDSDAAPHDQAPAQVAVAPDGAVYVVWQNNRIIPGRRFPASDLRIALSLDAGRTFSPATYVNDDAGGLPTSHTFHDIAVGADGAVHVSWIDGRARVLAETDDEGHAAMHHAAGPGSEVRIATSVDGGQTFGASRVVMEPVCPCCRTALALGGDGRVHIGFRSEMDSDLRDIVVATSTDGGDTFGEPVRVHADDWRIEGCPHAGPGLTLDGAGRLHVAWYTGEESRQGVHYAVSSDGGRTFSSPAALLTGGWVPVSQVKLAAESAGRVWIAWSDPRTDAGAVRLAVVDGDSPRSIFAENMTGGSPDVAAGEAGAWVAWLDGGAVRVRFVR